MAVDEPVDGIDRVLTTEGGTNTPDEGTYHTDGDELDPMGCPDAPVGTCWNNYVRG